MNGGNRSAGVRDLVDDVAHALHVFEEQLARVIHVDVGLRRAIHGEGECAILPTVWCDFGKVAAQFQGGAGVLGHGIDFATLRVDMQPCSRVLPAPGATVNHG